MKIDHVPFQLTERPAKSNHRGRPLNAITRAVLGTAVSGGAVRFSTEHIAAAVLRHNLVRTAMRHGLIVVVQPATGKQAIAWCEPATTQHMGLYRRAAKTLDIDTIRALGSRARSNGY